ncbi:MAG: hypothetical protein ABFS35_12850 [Bacteroidota bacterium]
MKKVFVFIILSIFSTFIFAQNVIHNPGIKWRQQQVRINLSLIPQVEFVKIAGVMDFNISLSGVMTFNNKFFIGGYASKMPMRTYKDYAGINYAVSYQQLGIHAGQNVNLGLYRTKGGHYVRRKTKFIYSLKLGGAAIWLVNKNKEQASSRDYSYMAQANLGVTRPLGKFINLEVGGLYVAALTIDQLGAYFDYNDFSGPGAYIALKFNLFR